MHEETPFPRELGNVSNYFMVKVLKRPTQSPLSPILVSLSV